MFENMEWSFFIVNLVSLPLSLHNYDANVVNLVFEIDNNYLDVLGETR